MLLTPVDIRLSGGALRAGPQQGELDRQTLGQDMDGGHLCPVHAEQHSHVARRARLLARRHGLSGYDAAYLETAKRCGGKIATLDRKLAAVAAGEGVSIDSD